MSEYNYKNNIQVIHHQDKELVHEYLVHIADQVGLTAITDFEGDDIHIYPEKNSNVREFIDRLLEDYETLGVEVEHDVDIYDLVIYCSNPALDAYYTQSRMNINHCANEAFSELLSEASKETNTLRQVIDHMDGMHLINGVYKLRTLLQTMAEAMERSGIPVADKMNAVVKETIN